MVIWRLTAGGQPLLYYILYFTSTGGHHRRESLCEVRRIHQTIKLQLHTQKDTTMTASYKSRHKLKRNSGHSTRTLAAHWTAYLLKKVIQWAGEASHGGLLVPVRWSGTGLLMTGATRMFSSFFVLTTVATSEVAIMFVATSNQSSCCTLIY